MNRTGRILAAVGAIVFVVLLVQNFQLKRALKAESGIISCVNVLDVQPLTKSPENKDFLSGVTLVADKHHNSIVKKEYILDGATLVYHNHHIRENLDDKYAASLFIKYIHQPQIWCPQNVRLGRKEDGGWNACVSPPFTLKPSCIVYSFGIGGEWGFDDDVTKRFKCNLLAFDPTINKKEHKRSEYIHFYPEGLGGTNLTTLGKEKWPLKNFKEFLKKFNHSETVIDIVKMDVEYSEWAALDAMVRDGSLSNVKQLMFEIHTNELYERVSNSTHLTQYWSVLRGLHQKGFRLWHWHENEIGPFFKVFQPAKISCCYELYFLNLKYIS